MFCTKIKLVLDIISIIKQTLTFSVFWRFLTPYLGLKVSNQMFIKFYCNCYNGGFIVTVPVLVKSPVVVKEPSLETVKVAPVATETEFTETSELTIG